MAYEEMAQASGSEAEQVVGALDTAMLESKVALVTGASSGTGKEVAMMLEKEGYHVFVSARRADLLEALSSERITVLPMDLTDDEQVTDSVDFIVQAMGRIDLLVNCAGYGMYSSVEEADIEWALAQFDVNYFSVVRATRAVLPYMREAKSGLIINISSVVGQVSGAFMGHYCASKHALEALSDALRMELSPFGIRVVIVEPGITRSGFEELALQQLADTRRVYAYDRMAKSFVQGVREMFTKSHRPDKIARVVRKAVRARRPARRYVVGRKNALLLWVRRVVGYRFVDHFFKRLMGL